MNGRRDHISSAGPFSKINQAAALTAEREICGGLFNRGFADGTSQLELTLAGHRHLEDTRDQIVIMRLRDLAAVELAWLGPEILRSVVHQNFAVDLRGVH